MQLQYFRGPYPNFGDELNKWLWPKLLPNFINDDASTLFLGIGSILGDHYPAAARKIVFGTGFVPNYHEVPDLSGDDWDIYFVRGPRTAKLLGLPKQLGLGDSAVLIRAIGLKQHGNPKAIGFMPHWESIPRGNWRKACDLAGLTYVDPTGSVDEVLDDLLNCKLLVTEAMHGAIVADALRIPWIPVLPIDSAHREKWIDWAEALGIDLKSRRLWPSSQEEAAIATVRRPVLHKLADSSKGEGMSFLVDKLIQLLIDLLASLKRSLA